MKNVPLSVPFSWSSSENRRQVVTMLQQDQIVLCSTDTVLGLLANLSERSFVQINRIKGRENRPAVTLIGDTEQVGHFVDVFHIETKVQDIMAKFWPGPLTIIFKAKPSVPDYLKGPGGTISLRVPQHEGLLDVLKSFDGLFSTSANLTGQPVATKITEVDPAILSAVSGVITDTQETYPAIPSTIIDVSSGEIKLIRAGASPFLTND